MSFHSSENFIESVGMAYFPYATCARGRVRVTVLSAAGASFLTEQHSRSFQTRRTTKNSDWGEPTTWDDGDMDECRAAIEDANAYAI